MNVYVKGQGSVTLAARNFVAEGGEGRIYARGDVAYKIAHDATRALTPQKLLELRAIRDDKVLTPQALVLDARRRCIGHTMPYLRAAHELSQLAARSFRERHQLGPAKVLAIVEQLRQRVLAVHAAGALVVDLTGGNFMLNAAFDCVFAIDCDSYQTAGSAATAISPHVRDPQTQRFSQDSDWFAFAVVAFQCWIGIHPFKGKHPQVKGLAARMAQGLSVLEAAVRRPPAAYELADIPQSWRDWFQSIFRHQGRAAPPAVHAASPSVAAAPVPAIRRSATSAAATGPLRFEVHGHYPATVRHCCSDGDALLAVAGRAIYADARPLLQLDDVGIDAAAAAQLRLLPTRSGEGCVAAWLDRDGQFRLLDVGQRIELQPPCQAEALMQCHGKLYAKHHDRLTEVLLHNVGGHVIAAGRPAARVHAHATRLFDGVFFQRLLGASYACRVLADGQIQQAHLSELDDRRIVDARHDGGVLMVVTQDDDAGVAYRRWVFRFSRNGRRHDVAEHAQDTASGLRFVCLDRGVCIRSDEAGGVEMFAAEPGSSQVQRVADGQLRGGDRLAQRHGKVLCIRGQHVYRISMT